MAESSRKRKTQVGARRRRGPAVNEPEEIIAPSQPQRLFSSVAQYERYTSKFSARDILEPRYPDDFIAEQNFECYDILHNLGLLPFLTNRQRYYPELVRVFYSNLQIIEEGVILSEVIHSFGFVKNQNGEWIHKRDMQDAPIHDDRTPSPPPQPTQDASAAMLNDIIHEIRDLRAFVGSRFDSIDARVGQLEEDMAYVRRQFPPS